MEEFALLVHGGDTGQIRRRAQEIQKRVQERALPGPEGGRRGSVSVGVACLPDPLAASAAALRLKAEQALEMARQKRPGGLIIL
jgi:GGDEF domain-containing protein